MTDHPLRVRLHGGRNVHAARRCDDGLGHLTACAIYLSDGADNDWQPENAPVQCRHCVRELGPTHGALRCSQGHPLPADFQPAGAPYDWDDTCRCGPTP